MVGQTISHYRILEEIGSGGMGVVYKALDTRLERTVAVKFLRAEALGSEERRKRFILEAKAASALNHPGIVTIHDIDRYQTGREERDFIVMEYVDGLSIGQLMARGPFRLDEALNYGIQIADALGAAHSANILHRDIKPGNVIVNKAGQAKVLDFGLAKLLNVGTAEDSTPTVSIELLTQHGNILGTVPYMSPEQAAGKPLDARSDIFSLGCVLYEMLSGRRLFQRESNISTLAAIIHEDPEPLRKLRPDVPAELERTIHGALEKDPNKRYASAIEFSTALKICQSSLAPAPQTFLLGRKIVAIPLFVILFAAVAAGSWLWFRGSRLNWVRESAIPEIRTLIDKGELVKAFVLTQEAERYAPNDLELRGLKERSSVVRSLRTDPPGCRVYFKDYIDWQSEWIFLGETPLGNVRVPWAYNLRWRIEKEGFDTLEVGVAANRPAEFSLITRGAAPASMLRVPAGAYQHFGSAAVQLASYWIDRYEVTNRAFKQFVDAGGYLKKAYWKHPFTKEGRGLSWEEGMAEFRDATGRPGPATWSLGTYPDGQDEFPVQGVSWYEAAAYAEFAGKSLPTIYHWFNAAGLGIDSSILLLSNFGDKAPARAGSHHGLGPYGTYDMAGNLKEWCWNESQERRYILGGAWNEPTYMFRSEDMRPPFDRSAENGFRCVRYTEPLADSLTKTISKLAPDLSKIQPATDDTFHSYQSFYSYDRSPLKAVVESSDNSPEYWNYEEISFDAAYGNERVKVHLYLPKNAAPPYQPVLYFPHGGAFMIRSDRPPLVDLARLDFIPRSGRALIYPIYKGTYSRRFASPPTGPLGWRDQTIQMFKDLGRTVDYLETRKDIDLKKLAYFGISTVVGPIMVALEPRIKVAVLVGLCLSFASPPEVDPANFAPRVRVPVLMINGKDDFGCPLEISQIPLFKLLGSPEQDKQHALFPGGHVPPKNEIIRGTLDWLDRYLGPVRTR